MDESRVSSRQLNWLMDEARSAWPLAAPPRPGLHSQKPYLLVGCHRVATGQAGHSGTDSYLETDSETDFTSSLGRCAGMMRPGQSQAQRTRRVRVDPVSPHRHPLVHERTAHCYAAAWRGVAQSEPWRFSEAAQQRGRARLGPSVAKSGWPA